MLTAELQRTARNIKTISFHHRHLPYTLYGSRKKLIFDTNPAYCGTNETLARSLTACPPVRLVLTVLSSSTDRNEYCLTVVGTGRHVTLYLADRQK